MGRRKIITLALKDLECGKKVMEELAEVYSDFEVKEAVLKMPQKKADFQLKEIDSVIDRLMQ